MASPINLFSSSPRPPLSCSPHTSPLFCLPLSLSGQSSLGLNASSRVAPLDLKPSERGEAMVVRTSAEGDWMTINGEINPGDLPIDENAPLIQDGSSFSPRRIALFVEPSPFSYVSGYKNRFQNFIRYLREMGDEVIVVTTHEGVPEEFYGAKVIGSWSFPCPLYKNVPLSLALSPRIFSQIASFKPDIIHASSPGVMVFGALIIAKLLSVPLVLSYHTHVPIYIPRYTFSWLVKPMWLIIKFLHRAADLTLVPSAAIGRDLLVAGVTAAHKIRLWNKGVDSNSFHPRHRNHEMRVRLSAGETERPLVVHVGRLGAEKSLDFLQKVMERLPQARIAFVGDGPYREELEKMFVGMPAVFTGMLHGEELSQAYASGDLFVMPSESETLGLVVLEAMSSGLPVVAARAGGIPDIIPEDQEGVSGFLFNPGDLDDCVEKMERLLTDRDFREIMGRAARLEMEKYDWRAATLKIRNEQYSAAIWFWRKKRAQLLRPIQWLTRQIFPSPQVNFS
ncbi:sulfoquinovosyldiacylglycerol 2 [Wolffia australiana]